MKRKTRRLSPAKNAVTAQIFTVTPTFASNAIRENCKDHGEIAKRKAETRATVSFFLSSKSSRTRTYTPKTASTPIIAEGNRVDHNDSPNNATEGIVKYTYRGGL